jgi:hypothetical protein
MGTVTVIPLWSVAGKQDNVLKVLSGSFWFGGFFVSLKTVLLCLKLKTFLPRPPECWDYRHAAHLAIHVHDFYICTRGKMISLQGKIWDHLIFLCPSFSQVL